MNKHTQGKWKAIKVWQGLGHFYYSVLPFHENNWHLTEKDAQLIASAPRTKAEHGKMLSALKNVLPQIVAHPDVKKDIQSLITEIEK